MIPSARAQAAPTFTFTVAGDYGGISAGTCGGTNTVDSCGQAVAKGIAATNPNPNFHIALGDFGYNSTKPANWCSRFKSYYSNLVLVTGNHDTWNGGFHTYSDGTNGTASDTLTTEDGPGFLDSDSGYAFACGVPAGIDWVGSGTSFNGASDDAFKFKSKLLRKRILYRLSDFESYNAFHFHLGRDRWLLGQLRGRPSL